MQYTEVFSKLTYELATIIFLKKNGEVRLMLGTRNLNTINLIYGFQNQVLGGHDNRCNKDNGNLAVYDMIVGDARAFNINRLIDINFMGVISTKQEYDAALAEFVRFRDEYEKTKPMQVDMMHIN